MPKTYKLDKKKRSEIVSARKENHDKQVEKRLFAVQQRMEGKQNREIAERLGTSSDVVSHWVSMYANGGIEALLPKKRQGHHRNMSYEEEVNFLAFFDACAQAGQILEVSDIERAYVEKVGHPISSGQIYRLLKRHNWRKVKPRSRHPKKASDEATEASKKLTLESGK